MRRLSSETSSRGVFLGQQPALHAGRLHGDRRHHRQRFGPPVRIADRRHAERERVRAGRRVDEAVDDVGDDGLHLRRVIDAEHFAIGAEQADRIGVPRFVTGFAEDPIDDRLLGPRGRGDAVRVGPDIVLAPHLALIVGQRAAAFGDARAGDARLHRREPPPIGVVCAGLTGASAPPLADPANGLLAAALPRAVAIAGAACRFPAAVVLRAHECCAESHRAARPAILVSCPR